MQVGADDGDWCHHTGAMVAISHDHQFCQAIDPTHVARVGPDGSVTVSLCIGGDLGVSKVAQGTTNGVSKGKKKTVPASIVKPGAQNGSTMPRAYGGASHTKPAVAPDMKRMQHVHISLLPPIPEHQLDPK